MKSLSDLEVYANEMKRELKVQAMKVLPPKRLCTCWGMSNLVFDMKRDIIGWLYFWDFDGFKDDFGKDWHPDNARRLIMWLCHRYDIDLHLFETKNGFHLHSFSILNEQDIRLFLADTMQWLPSNYWRDHNLMFGRVTRKHISPLPRYAFGFVPDGLMRPISLGHMQKLVDLEMMPPHLLHGKLWYGSDSAKLVPTYTLMHIYITRVK